ncbi:MAG: OsmC family protein [Planctomycetes bacterium]|nr:OsmC family protein [Planctomycetota bacterium]
MATQTTVNGLDTDALREAMQTMLRNPETGRFRFRAHHLWIDGAHSQTQIVDFQGPAAEESGHDRPFLLDADEPAALLGTDEGPNATEALLHALASCLSTTLIFHAGYRGVTVNSLQLELEGDIDLAGFLGLRQDTRNGYQEIRVAFIVDADAPDETIDDLVDLAQQHSPVFDIVTNPVPVKVTWERA